MKNIPTVTCNTVLHPPIKKIAFLLLFRPVTRVTGVTPRNKRNMLHLNPPFLEKPPQILIFLKSNFKILFFWLLILSSNTLFAQIAVTRVTATPFIKKLGQSDLPDFSKAIEINDCENRTLFFDMNQIPLIGINRNLLITEHLQHLPKSNLTATLYYLFDGKLLKENKCENWIDFVFEPDGSLKISLFWGADTFLIFTSADEPSCEVILWMQPTHIPMGRKAFLNCVY